MARLVRGNRLENRSARLALAVKAEPYWIKLSEGEHLGYYRGTKQQKWVARYRVPGIGNNYRKVRLGDADDYADANNVRVLDYRQAQAHARAWFALQALGAPTAPYTVDAALDDYLAAFTGKSVAKTRARIDVILRPSFGKVLVSELQTETISNWLQSRASSPAKLRTSKLATEMNQRETVSDEAIRRRRSTANRDLTVCPSSEHLAQCAA